jgi:chorismate dehydratase
MINISAVSYLNTIPFIYGLKSSKFLSLNTTIHLDYPSICADKLINGVVDIGLVPIVAINSLPSSDIISNFCIGSNGKVDTVCIYSDVPINKIETILLDYQSRTSILLLQVLLKEYWNLNPSLVYSDKDYIDSIKNTCAGLVIGDRAFNLNERYNYVYDLSDMWKNLTGLPFVFAVWIANKKINEEFVNHFNDAIQFGLDNIKNALLNFPGSYVFCEDPEDYLNNKIEYILDDRKSESIHLFFEKMNQI